ncbi:hypothetical protein C0J52_27596 [Blattella germanica]|nr:hypothetical protein C0J52_27596 [Blattella germanica]
MKHWRDIGFWSAVLNRATLIYSSAAMQGSLMSAIRYMDSEGHSGSEIMTICTKVTIYVKGIPGSDVRCTDPVRVLGCNMVGHHCKCSEVPVCPGESPFSFTSHDECEMNLAVMLAHEQSDASGQGDGVPKYTRSMYSKVQEGARSKKNGVAVLQNCKQCSKN